MIYGRLAQRTKYTDMTVIDSRRDHSHEAQGSGCAQPIHGCTPCLVRCACCVSLKTDWLTAATTLVRRIRTSDSLSFAADLELPWSRLSPPLVHTNDLFLRAAVLGLTVDGARRGIDTVAAAAGQSVMRRSCDAPSDRQ